ncbi:jg7550 [Pararge aegeria aegeria]|uniref:Jg7550 protein n=1 Tax=Pararge aegeria aegeria TaxID=348720 RepID=A0A8S4S4S4_9NEOP|nr:jg7550 [Pararge aegeria aegeria]
MLKKKEKSDEVLSSEPQQPDDDHHQSVKTVTTKKKKCLRYSTTEHRVLGGHILANFEIFYFSSKINEGAYDIDLKRNLLITSSG